MSKTILLTGFEPFGGESVNPSWEAVRRLDGETLAGAAVAAVAARRLPCVFGEALAVLREEMAALRPALIVAVGQAGGRPELSLERVAINVDDARIADNAGRRPIDRPVVPGGPAAYFSTLPIKAQAAALRAAGIPAAVSQSAGTFVCNHVFYGLMHALAGTPARGGFIHIPYLPEQAAAHPGAPSMSLETIVAGLRLALETALTATTDIVETGGATH
ncbi:pyroglutamyl-peptidase I [Chromobacterium sp. Beijing]|uniref:pyroglutamyl-peptidase I n=1 Tax=Chromobacterium sp. Beijing TaxID=2735795 RepID=UPI001F45EDAA|nr:pyroglutamyl-peptidase I [Chromobacterium sp. Beijing]UJB30374.1 pyroglutamyl-peptidase I [Chromobacterium sp. Beijing]